MSSRRVAVVPRAAARGVVGAMAMTGFRTMAVGLGLLRETPPEEIARRGLPEIFQRVPRKYHQEAIQLAHWGYGAGAGIAFALLPAALRRQLWAGPAYGLGIWLVFEAVISPALGLRTGERRPREKATLAVDHVLYGLVVAARPRGV